MSKSKDEPWHEISNNVVCATGKGSDQPAQTRSLIRAFASHLTVLGRLSYWPNIIWSFLSKKEAARARLSLHLSKYHIVGNHMSRLKYSHTTDASDYVILTVAIYLKHMDAIRFDGKLVLCMFKRYFKERFSFWHGLLSYIY